MRLMREVRRIGFNFYNGKSETDSYDVYWLSINSHIMTHTDDFVKRFGSLRNTWVFSFESLLGGLKRYSQRHKNGRSEGAAMLKNFWDRVSVVFLLAVHEKAGPKLFLTPFESSLIPGRVVEMVDGSFFQIKSIVGAHLIAHEYLENSVTSTLFECELPVLKTVSNLVALPAVTQLCISNIKSVFEKFDFEPGSTYLINPVYNNANL